MMFTVLNEEKKTKLSHRQKEQISSIMFLMSS